MTNLEKNLSQALYALNRSIAELNEDKLIFPDIELEDVETLVSARDTVWGMLQTIDPKEWRD